MDDVHPRMLLLEYLLNVFRNIINPVDGMSLVNIVSEIGVIEKKKNKKERQLWKLIEEKKMRKKEYLVCLVNT